MIIIVVILITLFFKENLVRLITTLFDYIKILKHGTTSIINQFNQTRNIYIHKYIIPKR